LASELLGPLDRQCGDTGHIRNRGLLEWQTDVDRAGNQAGLQRG
jgi:hypothetical protein